MEIEMPICIEDHVFKAAIPIQTEQLNGQAAEQVTGQPTGEVQTVIGAFQCEIKLKKLMDALDLTRIIHQSLSRPFRGNFFMSKALLRQGFLEQANLLYVVLT